MKGEGVFVVVACAVASLFASSKTDAFVIEARRLYSKPEWAGYTNTLLTASSFATHPGDFDDRPRCGDRLVRWVEVEGARNVRDIGGWNGLPIGRVYRGSELNAVTNHGLSVTSKGVQMLRMTCGIRTDVDFRAVNTLERGSCVNVSALGPDISLVDCPIGNYLHMFSQTNLYRNTLRVFADPSVYPVYMHCWGGADRTGTVAFILEGLCGVSEVDLAIDYELTSFSCFDRRRRNGWTNGVDQYARMIGRIKSHYRGETLQDKFVSYARETLGLTPDEIASIQQNVGGTANRGF